MIKIIIIAVALIALISVSNSRLKVFDLLDTPDINTLLSSDKQFDNKKHSLSNPKSIWVIVNKHRPLTPKTFAPTDLVSFRDYSAKLAKPAASALESLFREAGKSGHNLKVVSGYRSYYDQVGIYNSEVKAFGKAQADRESARPGYSEHQTGLAVDVGNASGNCQLKTCFGESAGGRWLSNNDWRYGFVVRYQEGKEKIVGYKYEPWHIRYVGKELAGEINKSKKTLEEYFDFAPAPDYNKK